MCRAMYTLLGPYARTSYDKWYGYLDQSEAYDLS